MIENKLFKTLYKDVFAIVVGASLSALGVVCFTVPNNIAPGGVSGLSTAISAVTGIPLGVLAIGINIPLFLLAWRVFGLRPLVKTICATVLMYVLIDVLGAFDLQYTGNRLLSAVLGGALLGAGIGVVYTRNISTGGTDLLGLIIQKKKPELSPGSIMMALDCAVVVIAVMVFQDIEVALYSIVTIFCTSKVIDAIMQGVDYAKMVYIITEKGEEMTAELIKNTHRGVTEVEAKGGYTGRKKSMLMIVVRRRDAAVLQKTVQTVDPEAFVIYTSATEVRGKGFKELR